MLVDGDDVGPRGHDFPDRAHAEGHHPADEKELVVGAETDRGALPPDRPQIGRAGGRARGQEQADHPRPRPQHRDDAVGHRLRARLREPPGNEVRGEEHERHAEDGEGDHDPRRARAREPGQRGAHEEHAQ